MQSKSEQTAKHLADEEIIDLYWNRDESAIGETDKKYGKYLYTIAHNIIHDDPDCEECLNDTYLSTWNQIPPTRPTLFQMFLSRIMRNIAVDKYRRNSAAKRIPSELSVSLDELDDCLPGGSGVEEELLIKCISDILNEYLKSLSRREMLIFVCRYYYADRVKDIAAMLKISESTVFRDLEKLRKGLKERLDEEGISV